MPIPTSSQKFIGVTLPLRRGQITGMFTQSTTLLEQTRSNFKNLILTKKGERLNSNLGCDLWKVVLFNQLTPETIEKARIAVIEAVETWLPYLNLLDFQITPSEETNKLSIQCTYQFRNNPNVIDEVRVTIPGLENTVAVSSALDPRNQQYQSSYGMTTRQTQNRQTIRGGVRGVAPEV